MCVTNAIRTHTHRERETNTGLLFPNLLFGERCTRTGAVLRSSVEGSACLLVVSGGGLLSAQEAGLLLSHAVPPLTPSQLRTVPPENTRRTTFQKTPVWVWLCPALPPGGRARFTTARNTKLKNSPLLLHLLLGFLLVRRLLTNGSVSLLVHFLHLPHTHTRARLHHTLPPSQPPNLNRILRTL